MSGLRQLLEMRRSELRKEAEPLEATATEMRSKLGKADEKLKAIAKEIAEIDKALNAIGREKLETEISIKDAIVSVLMDSPGGLSSFELLVALNERFFEGRLVRTSMSPQLTRLKNDDRKIKTRGGRWFLA